MKNEELKMKNEEKYKEQRTRNNVEIENPLNPLNR